MPTPFLFPQLTLFRSPISFDVGKFTSFSLSSRLYIFDDVDFSAAALADDRDVCVLGVTQKVKIERRYNFFATTERLHKSERKWCY